MTQTPFEKELQVAVSPRGGGAPAPPPGLTTWAQPPIPAPTPGVAHRPCVIDVPGSPLPGSSITSSASEALGVEAFPRRRLVKLVPKLMVISAVGITESTGSGKPPVQVKMISPIDSDMPSARSAGGTELLAIQRSGPVGASGVISVALLAIASGDPPPETVTELVNKKADVAETSTRTVIGGYSSPGARTSDLVQELPAQVQPVPIIDLSARPDGRFSVTVTAPIVGPAVTLLLTVTV